MAQSKLALPDRQHVKDALNVAQTRTLRLVQEELPNAAVHARERLSQLANDISAAIPRDRIAQLAGKAPPASKARRLAKGAVLAVSRRPLVAIVGGAVIISLGYVVRNRLKARAEADKQIGEGSYEGAKAYKEDTKAFLAEKGNEVVDLAQQAKRAVESSERRALEDAEAEGRRRARR